MSAGAPGDAEVGGDVGEEADVHILEQAGADVVGLGGDEFFGDAGPELDGAGEVLALHDLLDGERGDDVERHAGVVAFAVAGRAFDHGLMPADAGLLRGLRDVVDIGAERDDGLAGAPGGDPRGGDAGDAALDFEAFLFEDAGEVFGGFEFLEAQFAEAEDAVDHDLRLLLHGVDLAGEVGLHGGFFVGRDFRLGEGGCGEYKDCG